MAWPWGTGEGAVTDFQQTQIRRGVGEGAVTDSVTVSVSE